MYLNVCGAHAYNICNWSLPFLLDSEPQTNSKSRDPSMSHDQGSKDCTESLKDNVSAEKISSPNDKENQEKTEAEHIDIKATDSPDSSSKCVEPPPENAQVVTVDVHRDASSVGGNQNTTPRDGGCYGQPMSEC